MIGILYENEALVVVEKPEGLATIPERFQRSCLLDVLQETRGEKLYVVHRLDKDVSGIVVFARNAEMHRQLNKKFETREVHKTYVAIVHDKVSPFKGVIDSPIRQFGSGRMGVDNRKGKPCVTRYEVRKQKQRSSWLEVYPITGRRHQIRVHLYSIGHPIVGDPLYGEWAHQESFARLFLHATRLTLPLDSGGPLTIDSPVPQSFVEFFETDGVEE